MAAQGSAPVLEMLQEAISSANESTGRDVCAFIGLTGSGKSTIVNSLFGKRMVRTRVGHQVQIEVEGGSQNEIARIGHHRLASETFFAKAYRQEQFPYTLVDCGGFLDTRGAAAEVAIAVSMKLILENARSVRLAVCYDSNGLGIRRGGDLCDLLDRAYRKLLRDGYNNEEESIALILTKVNRSDDGWHYNDDANSDALNYLTECKDEALEGGEQRALFEFIIREGGRFLKAYKPLERASVAGLKALFEEMEGIQHPRGKFRLTYSAESTIAIMRGFTQIALAGGDLLDQLNSKKEERRRQNLEMAALNQQINRMQNAVQRLAPEMNPSIEEIDQIKENLIFENRQTLETENIAIVNLQGQMDEEDAALEAVRAHILEWRREGEQEIEYWSQTLNQKGIPGQKGTTVTVTTKKSAFLGFIGGGSKTETHTTPDVPGRSIEHDFQYRGPKYIRIVKDTPRGTWSDEVESHDKTSYSVRYDSGVGVDAVATIKAIIARADDPSEQQKFIGFQAEETRRVRQKNDIAEQIRERQEVVTRAQGIIVAAQNIRERLQDIRDELTRIENSRTELNQRIVTTNEEKNGIEEQISQRQPHFQFLQDYLRLSDDEHIRSEPLIAQFLDKYDQYQQPTVS